MPKNFQISQYDEPLASTAGPRRRGRRRRDRAAWGSSGCTWRRTPASRCTSAAPPGASTARRVAGGLQPGRHPAGRDRHQADLGHRRAGARGGPGVRHRAARRDALPRRLRRPDGAGLAALRREHLAQAAGRDGVGHPHRDQERQLAALGRARGPLGDQPAGRRARRRRRRSCRRPGTSTRTPANHPPGRQQGDRDRLPLLPGARPGAARARPRPGWTSCGPRCRSCRRARRARLQARLGLSDKEMQRPGQRRRGRAHRGDRRRRAPRPGARKWWMGELARRANEQGVELAELPVTPAGRRARRRWSTTASSTTSWPGRCSRACSPARATPDEVVAARGLGVVSDAGALPRPSTRRSPPTRTSPRRSATARSRRPARSSARS